jgi:diaminopropionate ammonia-lyase
MRIVLNPHATRGPYTERERMVVSSQLSQEARREISQWSEYAPSPLRRLTALASQLGVGELLYKDESNRLGQGSFKILGGAYAATLMLRGLPADNAVTLCCATDGNHGRSVAFAAKRHGCPCVVFMHEHAPVDKAAAISALGAKVIRVAGTYDDSVRHAQQTAKELGWMLIADTSDNALDITTRKVIQGYGVMVLEVVEQLNGSVGPTHVFVQAGVGGLAAAVAGILAEVFGTARPRLVVVEPAAAACLLQSALHGEPAKVGGNLRTVMEMLSAGEASAVAWPVLEQRADVFVAIEDAAALHAAHTLTRGREALSVGLSGAAGYAGLEETLKHPEVAAMLGLGKESRVLVFGTEQALSH